MRTKYGSFAEYHTSLDNLDSISPAGLGGAFEALRKCILVLEANHVYKTNCLGEPQLGRRGLYPNVSENQFTNQLQTMMNLLAYADGQHDLVGIADRIGVPAESCLPIIERLMAEGLLRKVS